MQQPSSEHSAAPLLRLATYASVTTAAVLIAAKFAAWFMTGSLSVLASLVDSFMDAAASLVNLLAVRYSLKSPDRDHRFGHGKAEQLAGLGQASFIAGSALLLLIHTFERLVKPQPLTDINIGIGVMAFSILLTLILLAVQRHVIKKTQSTAIKADSLHYATDLLTNTGTIIALILASLGFPGADPIIAVGIALFILYSAWRIGYEAAQLLMDRQLSRETEQAIREIALDHEKVLGLHDLRTRRSGMTMIIQMHLELDDRLPLAEAHAAAKEVELRIREQFPEADITIHQDPIGDRDKPGRNS